MSWKPNLFALENIQAFSLALLLFTYLIVALAAAQVRYFETEQRVTVQQTFDQTIFGSTSGDVLAVIGFALLFVAASFSSLTVRIATIAVFGAGIATLLSGYEQQLHVAGLATVPVLGALIFGGTVMKRRIVLAPRKRNLGFMLGWQIDAKRVGVAFLAIIILVEVGALSRWIAYPIVPSQIYGDGTWRIAELESALFHAFGLLSPAIVILLVFSFLYKNFLRSLVRKSRSQQESIEEVGADPSSSREDTRKNYRPATGHQSSDSSFSYLPPQVASPVIVSQSAKLSQKPRIPQLAILIGAMIISIGVTVYPHLPGVNQLGTGISTDEQAYINWLAEIRSLESQGSAPMSSEMIAKVFTRTSDRPLSILLMLVVSDLTGQPDSDVVRFIPAALAPAFVLAIYSFVRYGYLVHEIGKDVKRNKEIIGAVIALAASFSSQIVVGLYGGFLANWLALIPGLLAMLFAVRISDEAARMSEKGSRKRLTIYASCFFATLTLAMLFHVYTWGFVIIVSLLFAFFSYFSMRKVHLIARRDALKVMVILVGVMVASVVTDVARSAYFSSGSGLTADSFVAGSSLELGNYATRWETLGFTLEAYVGGFLSHPGVMMLALCWAFKSSYVRGFDRLIFSMLFVLAIPLLFGNLVIQARLLYMVPLFIPAIVFLSNAHGERHPVSNFAIVALITSLATYSLRAMANLYLVLPEGYEIDTPFLVP